MPRSYAPCSFPCCPRTFYAHDLCKLHYTQRREGRPLSLPAGRVSQGVCSFSECSRAGYAHSLCKSHAAQARRGRPLTPLRPYVFTKAPRTR